MGHSKVVILFALLATSTAAIVIGDGNGGDSTQLPEFNVCPCVINDPHDCNVTVPITHDECLLEEKKCGACSCSPDGPLICQVIQQPYWKMLEPVIRGPCIELMRPVALCPPFIRPSEIPSPTPTTVPTQPPVITPTPTPSPSPAGPTPSPSPTPAWNVQLRCNNTEQLDWAPFFCNVPKRLCPTGIKSASLDIRQTAYGSTDIMNSNFQRKSGRLILGLANNVNPPTYFPGWKYAEQIEFNYTLDHNEHIYGHQFNTVFDPAALPASQTFINAFNALPTDDEIQVSFKVGTFNRALNSVIQNMKMTATGVFTYTLTCTSPPPAP